MLQLYAQAAAGSLLPGAVWGGGDRLPDVVLEQLVRPDPARLAKYREVCGFPEGDGLPVTYPHLLGFPLSMQLMTARSFPLPLLGMVHVANTITAGRSLPADAELTVRVHAEGPFKHRRGAEVDLVTEVLDGDGLAWREVSTYLAKGSKMADGLQPRPLPEWPSPPADAVTREVRIADDVGRRYASASGDRNPIHLHPLSARAFGFKRAIAHGMWSLANCLAVVDPPVPPPLTVAAAFRRPLLLPATADLRFVRGEDETRIWLTSGEETHLVVLVGQDRSQA